MTESAKVDNENNRALLPWTLFKVSVKGAVIVRLSFPLNWSITTASLPRSTETAVTSVFSCRVNVERNVDDGS